MKKIYLSFLISCCISGMTAQVEDLQFWENINLEKNITPRLVARINQQARITENITRPSFNYFDMGFDYKINKYLHVTAAYVWAEKKIITDFWSTRQQAYFDIVLKKKVGNFQCSDRQMFQWQVKDVYHSENGKIPDYYLRNKITVKYKKYFKWTPYVASEVYYKMNDDDLIRYRFNRIRCFAGLFYRTNLRNEFEAYYLMERHFNVNNPLHNWITGLGYTHRF